MNETLHVVFGAGQVGPTLAERLLARGLQVRIVRRGDPGPSRPGLQWMRGDVYEPAFAAEACRGAAVVYNCLNAPYHQWPELLPKLSSNLLNGARAAGARLVVLDNLYLYGRVPARGFDESTPVAPNSRKGEVRAKLVADLFAAHARGEVQVTSGRASDYFGPAAEDSAMLGQRNLRRIFAGKSAQLLAPGTQPHSLSYVPDVAEGLAILGTRDEAVGRAWHLPVAPALTMEQLFARFGQSAGISAKVSVVPRWLLRAMGLFAPLMRELPEMLYQWEAPWVVDDSAFRRTFNVEATSWDAALAGTAAWAKARFGAASPVGAAAPA